MEIQFPDYSKSGIREFFKNFKIPKIYNICDTVDMLVDTGKSFSRFGDGELKIMTNPNIDHNFQMNSEKLRSRLKEIIVSTDDGVEIGINRIYFFKDGNEHEKIEEFLYKKGYGNTIIKDGYANFLKREHYYDSAFTIPCHHYNMPKEFFEEYFNNIKKIWNEKNIILVTGDSEIFNYKFNIFKEFSKSIQFVNIAKKHAFEYQKRILYSVRKMIPYDRKSDYVVLFGCGIAATVFSYDFGREGICQSIDIGHLAKEYNNFKLGVIPWSKEDLFFSGTKTEEASKKYRNSEFLKIDNTSYKCHSSKKDKTWNRNQIPYFHGGKFD